MINESKTALILSSITNNSETKFEINFLPHFFIHRYYMFDFAKKTKKTKLEHQLKKSLFQNEEQPADL